MTESMATKTKEAHFIMRGRAMHCLLCGLPELPASVECLVPSCRVGTCVYPDDMDLT